MPNLLINGKVFEETNFENENELEKAVIQNKRFILGNEIILLDYKRKIGALKSRLTGIPDGLLLDFSTPKTPRLYFLENELESHDLYEHIGPQIMKFYASFDTAKRDLHKKIMEIIKNDKKVKDEIDSKLGLTPFENIDSLLNHMIYDSNVGIVVVIDDQTEDFNSLLAKLKEKPEVIELKKYQYENEIVYQYLPFKEGLITTSIEKSHRTLISVEAIDTIVCAAKEEGFKHAFIENDSWWAIRISSSIIPQLKYIAMYEKLPVAEIRWVAKIKSIKPYKDSGKYIVYVEDKKKITPIKLDKNVKGAAPQSPRYTSFEKLMKSKFVHNLWYVD